MIRSRIIPAAAIVAVTCLAVFLSRISRVLFFALCAAAALWEAGGVYEKKGVSSLWYIHAAFCLVTGVLCLMTVRLQYCIGLFVLASAVLFTWYVIKADGEGAESALFLMCWPTAFFAAVIYASSIQGWAIVLVTAVGGSWICDSCALIFGRMLGRHKLAPAVSPNKTAEGALFGMIASLPVGAIVFLIFMKSVGAPLYVCVIAAFVSTTLGQIGDLAASLFKRMCGVKDFSDILGEHGGIMDKFDSILFSVPAAMFIYMLFKVI